MTRLDRVRERRDDSGMSLVELIVAMGIFSIVIAIFMAGIVTMTRNTVRVQVTSDASESVRRVFQRLDKQVRYADAINLPGSGVSGARYVEFRTPETVAASGVTTCTQWRWNPATKLVQVRSWAITAGALPAWSTVASNVVVDGSTSTYPFELLPATADHPRQSLVMRLLLESDASEGSVSSESTFVARNSSVDSPGNKDNNGDGVADTPACPRANLRP